MLSQLDRDLSRIMDALTAEGGMFATVPFQRAGWTVPMIAAAPPSLAAYFALFCAQQGDREFIIDGGQRLTFAQIYAAARVVAGGLVEGHGVQKGERVGIVARNSASWPGSTTTSTKARKPSVLRLGTMKARSIRP